MIIDPLQHAKIFQREAELESLAWRRTTHKRALDLLQEHEVIPALLVDPRTAVLAIQRKRQPREDWNYSLQALDHANALPRHWGHQSLDDLLHNSQTQPFARLVRTGKRSQALDAPHVDLLELQSVPLEFLQQCNPGQHVALVPTRPPLEYLLCLKKYVAATPSDPILSIPFQSTRWSPTLIADGGTQQILLDLDRATVPVILQGPPGTGKTYLAAEVAAHYLKQGSRVCVTSLSRRALMELSLKPALRPYLQLGRVAVKSLTSSEINENRDLTLAEGLTLPPGQLLLSTYYSLSDWANNLPTRPIYDLLIVEEASQAFLATLSLFSRLAHKLLIVGDPCQLAPILNHKDAALKHIGDARRAEAVVVGLKTFAYNGEVIGSRLTRTFRLGNRAARLTGLFYDSTLSSAQDAIDEPQSRPLPAELASVSATGDGPVLLPIPPGTDAVLWIIKQAARLAELQPAAEIAVMFPLKMQVKQAQAFAAAHPFLRRARVETIDRMQGATVDYAFLALLLGDSAFAFAPDRFNVATSRARFQTWVVSDQMHSVGMGVGAVVGQFWDMMLQKR